MGWYRMFKWLFVIVSLFPAVCSAQTVLILGDSISAAYGLPSIDRGWVALLQGRLNKDRVVNASISGDTTAGGLSRIDALLVQHKPAVVVIELGANDGLRGLRPSEIKANLDALVARTQAAGAKVLLLGMKLPPNYGNRYGQAFEEVFAHLAAEKNLPYVPFMMQGVGGEQDLMQQDGMHPNEAAQTILLDNVWKRLAPLLGKPAAERGPGAALSASSRLS